MEQRRHARLLDGWQLSGRERLRERRVGGRDALDDRRLRLHRWRRRHRRQPRRPSSPLGGTFVNDGLRVVRPDLVGVVRLPRGQRDALTGWFNTAAFARPSGRGDYGDAARHLISVPASTTGTCRCSRTSRSAARGRSSSASRPTTCSITRSSPSSIGTRSSTRRPAGQRELRHRDHARNARMIQMSVRFSHSDRCRSAIGRSGDRVTVDRRSQIWRSRDPCEISHGSPNRI